MRQAAGMADGVASARFRSLPAVDLVDSMMVIIIAAILIILRYLFELRSSIITPFQRFISGIHGSVPPAPSSTIRSSWRRGTIILNTRISARAWNVDRAPAG
jgi:hypothetical protein